jgi:hypothetical protein
MNQNMNRKKLYLGLILTILGIIGMASMLTMDIPLPADVVDILKEKFTPLQIKLLIFLNPGILLIVAVVVGTILYQKVHLKVPIIEKLVGINKEHLNLSEIIKYGIIGGVITGVLLTLAVLIFKPLTPSEFKELSESLQPTLAARFLYGGFTEEILLRFGLMTLVVWLNSKMFKGTKNITYWTGIILASLIFAIGHFPIAFQSVDNPSIILLTYILIGNSIGGIVFGWLYWKKGLECAFLAHIFAHVILVVAEQITI